jgi:hypothetical protein
VPPMTIEASTPATSPTISHVRMFISPLTKKVQRRLMAMDVPATSISA